jgi:hypothetical protein
MSPLHSLLREDRLLIERDRSINALKNDSGDGQYQIAPFYALTFTKHLLRVNDTVSRWNVLSRRGRNRKRDGECWS